MKRAPREAGSVARNRKWCHQFNVYSPFVVQESRISIYELLFSFSLNIIISSSGICTYVSSSSGFSFFNLLIIDQFEEQLKQTKRFIFFLN